MATGTVASTVAPFTNIDVVESTRPDIDNNLYFVCKVIHNGYKWRMYIDKYRWVDDRNIIKHCTLVDCALFKRL